MWSGISSKDTQGFLDGDADFDWENAAAFAETGSGFLFGVELEGLLEDTLDEDEVVVVAELPDDPVTVFLGAPEEGLVLGIVVEG